MAVVIEFSLSTQQQDGSSDGDGGDSCRSLAPAWWTFQRWLLLCVIVRRVSTECLGVTRPCIVEGRCVVQYLALVECTHACLCGLHVLCSQRGCCV